MFFVGRFSPIRGFRIPRHQPADKSGGHGIYSFSGVFRHQPLASVALVNGSPLFTLISCRRRFPRTTFPNGRFFLGRFSLRLARPFRLTPNKTPEPTGTTPVVFSSLAARRLSSYVRQRLNMSLNPITAIEKLINEHGSATVLRERLALAADQFTALEKEGVRAEKRLVDAEKQLAGATAKIELLESRNADLEKQLGQRQSAGDVIDDPTHEVLKLLFKVDEGLDSGSIRSHLNMTEGVVRFHLDTLKGLDFIGHKRGRDASFGIYSEGTSFAPRGSPENFFIKPKGRAYIMKNGEQVVGPNGP
ncbi:MAG: hypothetical protein V4733_10085 [Verrucomicrobiota bacterium]